MNQEIGYSLALSRKVTAIVGRELLDDLKGFGVAQLLKLHCDWQMVKYEYDLQVKAKNAF